MSSKNRAEVIIDLQLSAIRVQGWQTCINCLHWNGEVATANGPAGCGLFQAMPPPRIIVNGCRDYEADIPF
jgi:hypothetical protein